MHQWTFRPIASEGWRTTHGPQPQETRCLACVTGVLPLWHTPSGLLSYILLARTKHILMRFARPRPQAYWAYSKGLASRTARKRRVSDGRIWLNRPLVHRLKTGGTPLYVRKNGVQVGSELSTGLGGLFFRGVGKGADPIVYLLAFFGKRGVGLVGHAVHRSCDLVSRRLKG